SDGIRDEGPSLLGAEAKPQSNHEGLMEFETRARVYLGARGPNEEKVPSSFR
ncbi:hypothetical protein Tco_0202762, partial [Tanacetum coccineum]